MMESRARTLFVAACALALAACTDAATPTTSPLQKMAGRMSAATLSIPLDSLSPSSVTLAAGATQVFTAWGGGSPFGASLVAFSVSGGGTIDATGLFTAGSTAGTFTVSATYGPGFPVVNASVTVTVATPPTTCKSDDDKKACDSETDQNGDNHSGNGHGDNGHGDKGHDNKGGNNKGHGDDGHDG